MSEGAWREPEGLGGMLRSCLIRLVHGPAEFNLIEGPLGRATPPPAIYDREPCGSDRQTWYAHQDRQMDDAKYVRIRSKNAVRPVTTTKHDN